MSITPTPTRTRPLWAVATVVAVVAAVAIWGWAVPREAACSAVYPASGPCSQADREAAGVTWTVVLAVAWAVALAVTLTVGRRRRSLGVAAVTALAVCAAVAFVAVLSSTGFVIY